MLSIIMKTILSTIQLIAAALLTIGILLQQRGTGLSSTFGGEGNVYRTKRGFEKMLFFATILFAVVFFGSSLAALLL